MEAFVYKWINLSNNKKYIGYHKGLQDDGYICSSSNSEFWNDFKNPNMKWERQILAEGTSNDCLKIEQKILKEIDLRSDEFYNNARGSEIIFTDNVLKKMSNSHKERWKNMSEEDRKDFSEKQSRLKKGIKRSSEIGENLSRLLKGKSFNERFGEEKAKIIGEKISSKNKGKHYHTDEWKDKLSKKLKGNNYGKNQTEEARKNKRDVFLSDKNPGKNKTIETRKKLSESLKGKQSKTKGISRKKIKCPYCKKSGGEGVMQRWHFNNCKLKNNE
jgi:hypothetical protein